MGIKLQVYTDLKKLFEDEIDPITVERYKGQYESGFPDWTVFPSILIRMDGNNVQYLAGGIQNYSIPVTLFVGAQNESQDNNESLDLIDEVEDLIDGKQMTLSAGDVKSVTIKKGNTVLLGYMKGGIEIYKISIELQ